MNNKEQLKDQLQAALTKKELVKPNTTEARISLEVESLCESFCNNSNNFARGNGGVPVDENDILF